MIEEFEINDYRELFDLINSLEDNFVYRGQSDANWGLESSLERILKDKWCSDDVMKFENYSLQEFQSKFHIYDRENIHPSSKLSWLSVMQHYGVPTRLLDFSESPYVALYFALEDYDPLICNCFSLYSIDYSAVMDVSINYIKKLDSSFLETKFSIEHKKDKIFEEIVDRLSCDILWISEPNRVNVRIDRQGGSFLLSGNKGKKIKEIIESPLYQNCKMYKYKISGSCYEGVYRVLRKANVNSKCVYGDLSGMAKYIKNQMIFYSIK